MGRVALITGGSRGIGFGIAHCLARDGYNLVISGLRDASVVEESLKSLAEFGIDILYSQSDVSKTEDRTRLLDETKKHFGKLHVLVNNAGVTPGERHDILDATEESFERILRVNLQGPYFLTQAVGKWMIRQKKVRADFRACIINIASISSTIASVNRGEYCISKAGLSMATKLWAVRLAAFDIPVYEVRPGIIATDMTAKVKEKYDKLIADGLLLQARWGLPEDVGRAVNMLVSGELSYATGQVIMVDGGLAMPRL
ncbi:MAG: 3-ketoacyl-ACP reductase [bacterium]